MSFDFNYNKYSLEQLDNWVNDALNCEDLTPEDIYDTIVNVVDESVEYHKKYLTKSIELLSLMKGHRPNVFDASAHDFDDFWYNSESSPQYTEEEMDAMCERAAVENDKEKCREYNLREAEYYNKRAQLDLSGEVKADGYSVDGVEHSKYYYDTGRNKSYEEMIDDGWQMTDDGFWIKETDKGYATVSKKPEPESKTWTLPVQESNVDGVQDFYIEFPDDLLKAADLKPGDTVEWIDRKDGSYELRKACPVCPPCENEMFSPE